MKHVGRLLVVVFVGLTLPARAAVTWNFDYTGAPDFNATSQASLEDAATTLGTWFAHTATIDIQVTSTGGVGSLASAGSQFLLALAPGFANRGIVGTKILSNGAIDTNGSSFDGTVNVNFGHTWDFDDSVSAGAFDFKSVVMHELIHAIGFASSTDAAGAPFLGGTAYIPFDEFLADNDSRLISPAGVLDTTSWNTAVIGGTGTIPATANTGLYFDGPNANAANGGNRVPLYSPTTYNPGSTASHLDTDFYTGADDQLMNHATFAGPGIRNLSPIERGMLTDLGFTLTAVPEPTSAVLAIFAAFAFSLKRRRR